MEFLVCGVVLLLWPAWFSYLAGKSKPERSLNGVYIRTVLATVLWGATLLVGGGVLESGGISNLLLHPFAIAGLVPAVLALPVASYVVSGLSFLAGKWVTRIGSRPK